MNRAIFLTLAALAAGCIDDPPPPREQTPAASAAVCPAADDDAYERAAPPLAGEGDPCAIAAVTAHLDALAELLEEDDHAE